MILTIIQSYAPTSDYEGEAIEEFYEEIEVTMATLHSNS